MNSVNCDGCKWCQSKGCNEHEKFAVWYPPAPASNVTLAPDPAPRVADECVGCLAESGEPHRPECRYAPAAHAPDVLRDHDWCVPHDHIDQSDGRSYAGVHEDAAALASPETAPLDEP